MYIYAPEIKTLEWPAIHVPGELALLRVPSDALEDLDAYEYFAGLDGTGAPTWSKDVSERAPAWSDPINGVMHPTAFYNPGLRRYILTIEHTERSKGNVAMYEAPEPWGPWSTVLLDTSFGRWRIWDNTFMWVVPTKWIG